MYKIEYSYPPPRDIGRYFTWEPTRFDTEEDARRFIREHHRFFDPMADVQVRLA